MRKRITKLGLVCLTVGLGLTSLKMVNAQTISENSVQEEFQYEALEEEGVSEDITAESDGNIIASGNCGLTADLSGMEWTLYQDGLLEIAGSGKMAQIHPKPWADVKDQIKRIVIKEGVTSISGAAFQECTNLTSVSIPNSVTEIEGGAFMDCTSLVDIELPTSITDIPPMIFWKCTSLKKITIPENVTVIGDNAYAWCESLEEIDIKGPVKTFPSIENCYKLVKVILPETIEALPSCAFSGASSLEFIELPSGITEIPSGAFQYCENLKQISIPEKVTKIGYNAFNGCSSLVTMKIPEKVTEIGYNALKGCTNLTEVNIPKGITRIESSTFSGCEKLKNITIPEGVTLIDSLAFNECASLKEIVIPNSVKEMGFRAFGYCEGLEKVIVGSGIEKMGEQAFILCVELDENFIITSPKIKVEETTFLWSGIRTILYAGSQKQWQANGNPKNLYYGSYTVMTVGIHYDGTNHTWDSIETKKQPTKNKEGEQIKGCSYCGIRKKISVPKKGTQITVGNAVYTVKSATEVELTKLKKKSKKVVVPEQIDYDEAAFYVTSIASKAFCKDTKLQKVEIGKNVKKIGKQAFSGCKNIKQVSIKTTVLSGIGEKAFQGCTKLKKLTIKSNKLTKNGVKNSLKGSGITIIKTNDNLASKYKKYFTKENSGRTITIKY